MFFFLFIYFLFLFRSFSPQGGALCVSETSLFLLTFSYFLSFGSIMNSLFCCDQLQLHILYFWCMSVQFLKYAVYVYIYLYIFLKCVSYLPVFKRRKHLFSEHVWTRSLRLRHGWSQTLRDFPEGVGCFLCFLVLFSGEDARRRKQRERRDCSHRHDYRWLYEGRHLLPVRASALKLGSALHDRVTFQCMSSTCKAWKIFIMKMYRNLSAVMELEM